MNRDSIDRPHRARAPEPHRHATPRLPTRSLLALAALSVLIGGPALAVEINGFGLVRVEGEGTLKGQLAERLGTRVNDTEHIINLEDCRNYGDGKATWEFSLDPKSASLGTVAWRYAAAYAPPGETCETGDTSPDTSGDCEVAASDLELDSSKIDFKVEFDLLTGQDCESNDEGDATIYVIVADPTGGEVQFETVKVNVDLSPPVAPVIDSVVAGDGRFTVRWTDDANNAEDVEYVVYWDEVDFDDGAIATVNSKKGIQSTSVAIESDSLVNGLTYYVRVAAVDKADNLSALSETLTVTPLDTNDFWEVYTQAGGTDQGDFCFVATAAYGTPMAGELNTLRAFRDQVLMGSSSGRAFVGAYYRWGRFAAAWIADKPALRAVVRVLLVPLIWLAKLALWLSPLGLLMAAGVALIALVWLRRRALDYILRDVPLEVRR